MRPIRLAVAAAGTYYIPVNREVVNTVCEIELSGLTITSVSWTNANIRMGASPANGGPINAPDNGVAAASAPWQAITAATDGSYRVDFPIDSLRVVLAGAGSANIYVNQEADG